jgi:hypothetical protein
MIHATLGNLQLDTVRSIQQQSTLVDPAMLYAMLPEGAREAASDEAGMTRAAPAGQAECRALLARSGLTDNEAYLACMTSGATNFAKSGCAAGIETLCLEKQTPWYLSAPVLIGVGVVGVALAFTTFGKKRKR